jgi:outer membrane protein assembly factor BamD (BamD/ComL family)
MQLGRAYQAKGNTAEAKKTFTEIVDNHPDSPYVAEARRNWSRLRDKAGGIAEAIPHGPPVGCIHDEIAI